MAGDSGGPVISLAGLPSGDVWAVGMIQAATGTLLSGSAKCGPAFDYGPSSEPNQCSATVLFTSMRTIVNSLSGASLLTV